MTRRSYKAVAFLFLTVLVMACMPSFAPSAPVPAYDPNSINTVIALTAQAAASQTALVVPPTLTSTLTALPTVTPSGTPSPTVTFIFLLATATVPSSTTVPVSSGQKFDCQVLGKFPADNDHMAPKADFTMTWKVANTGTELWDAGSADYHFKSGDRLHKAGVYDLPASVAPLEQAGISVDMKAPEASGTYSTVWNLKVGKTEFCTMSITIQVP